MANDIKVKLDLDGSSVSRTTKEAQKLRAELEAAARAAGNINTNKSAGSTKAYQSAMQGASSTAENVEYGIARSMGAGTGAAGRDFAKQAQGLGGLVHVYATFAANLFAVSAAFTALKNAADTTNMIKGLDQLGAASGRGLGSLSKEIVKLTDGAVTLREAMEATAKATAAGMSSEDLKRLAVGAKNASQALGVDMSDALSRLSRGITKLEPELLDELGIFVRVDKAASDYARTLGKPASALTDFEKRAAFAAATLEQVEKKFGAIKLDSNPYNQLLASLSNVVQVGLETINTFLEPVVRLLAASPTGLAIALASVGSILLKQAIPALGSFKESMRASAEASTALANKKMIDAKRAATFEIDQAKAAAEASADVKLAASEVAQQRLEKSQANSFKKSSKAYEIMNMNYADIEERHFQQLEKQYKRFETKDPATAQRYRVAIDGLREWVDAELRLADISKKAAEEYQKTHGKMSTIGQLQLAANKANQEAMTRQITSNAAYTASLQGPIEAWKELNKSIKEARTGGRTQELLMPVYDKSGKPMLDEQGKQITKLETLTIEKMGAMRAGWTRFTGAIGIATTAVGTFMNAFGTWMAVAGLVIAGVNILIDKFSATTKEAKATSEAFDALTASIENMDRVLARLEDINPLEKLSVENIQARATALSELSSSITGSIKKAFAQSDQMNWLDKEINTIKGYFGADLSDNLAESLGTGIASALKAAAGSKEATEARQKITNILGKVNLDDPKALKTVIEGMLDSGKLTKEETLQLGKAIEVMGKASATAAAKGTELKASMEATNKAAQDVTSSFLPSDVISKFGMSIMAESVKISQALAEPTQQLNALKGLLENPAQLAILDDATREVFLANRDAIEQAITSSEGYTVGIAAMTKELERLQKEKEDIYNITSAGIVDTEGIAKTQEQIDSLTTAIQEYKTAQENLGATLSGQGGINLDNIGVQMFKKGAEYFNQSVGAELAKAASQVTKAYTALAPNTATAAAVNVKADNAQLAVERELIRTNISLIDAIYENTQVTQIATLKAEKQAEEAKKDKDTTKIATLDKSINQLESSLAFVKGDKARIAAGGKPLDISSLAEAGMDSATIDRYMKLAGSNAAIFGKNMQIAANNIKLAIEQAKIKHDRELEVLDANQKINDLTIKRIGVVGTINGLMAPALLDAKQNLEITNQELENKKNISKATFEYNNVLKLIKQTGMENTEAGKADVTNAKNKLNLAEKTAESELKTLREKQSLEAAMNRVGVEKQLLDLQIQRGSIAVLSVDAQLMREQTLTQLRLDSLAQEATLKAANKAIEEQQAAVESAKTSTDRANAEAALAGLMAQKALSEELYSIKQKITLEQSNMNIAMAQANEIATSLNAIFAGMATSIGEFATTAITNFEKMNISAQQYTETMEKIQNDKKKAEDILFDPTSTSEQILKAQEDITKAEKDADTAKKKSIKDELTGNALILGSAKKMFNEKSAGYKILAGIEKAMHIAKLAMVVAEMFMDKTATTDAIVNSGAKQAANMAEAGSSGVAAVANQGKGDPYTAFPRIAAMVALMTAVMSMFGQSGGGASVSVPSFPTADQLQEVQGTGQDYQAGTLNLLSNGGGVLGDIKAKSEDIANSIDYIESHTFETLVYNNKMLAALKGIEVNTSEFVASLAQAGIIGINSPFGTQNTSSGGGNPGFLGMFGSSSSTSREVTDFGVKIAGAMGDLAKGVGEYLVYETVKTVSSWSSSGFFGIGGGSGTSTSYSTEFRNLNDDVITTLRALFVNASDFILASGEVLGGRTQAELQNIINRTEIKLDVSTFNLTGEEALADVKAEIGVEMNKLVYVAYPFLTEFQKLGEGLATTLARVTNDMQSVDVMFAQMGINFAEKFLIPADDVIAQNRLVDEKIATAQRKIQDARAALEQKRLTGYVQQQADIGYNEWGEMVSVAIDRPLAAIYATTQDYITGLEQMTNMDVSYTGWWGSYGEDPNKVAARDAARATLADYYAALQEEADAMNNRKFDIPLANTRVYEDLINKFGGDVQTFIDKTQFYIDNFVDENTVLMAHYDAVGKELNRLQGIYPNVALSTVDTRQEFITLVNSLDLASESGRQLYVDLMNLAPGFDVIANHLEDLISKAGLAADDFTNTMMDAIKGNLANTDIGANVANTIYDGIMTTISQSYVENIGNMLVQHIVTPIISAASTGATIVGAVSTATIQNVRNVAVASAQMLSAVFNDAEFIDALRTMSSQIGAIVQSFSDISASATNTGTALAASTRAMQDLISKAGLASSNFGTILKDAIAGNLAVSEIGTKVATMINDGILTAITDQFVNSIGEAITTNIITPLITAMTTGAALSSAVSASAIDSVRLAAGRAATAISTIFSDPVLLQTINSISNTIAENMKVVAATTQVSAGSISKIIAKTNTKIVDAYKKQASELTSTINRLEGFSDSLKDFRDSLLTGNLSPLTPLEKYNNALSDLNNTYALAMSGDEEAIARLKTVAQTFLDMSAEYYASSDAYVTDFNKVQTMLAGAISAVDSQVSIYQQQLDTANSQLNKLGSIDDTAKSIEELLREAQAIQKEEIANILSGGFVSLDRNLDGLLNIDELKAANLASDSELAQVYQMLDSNGDGQISALEALQGATEGTTYSVNSLAPLLSQIYNGTVSVEEAIQYLAKINLANVAAGGSALDIDFRRYLPTDGTGGTGVGYDGVLNQVYNTLGIAKNPADMMYWSQELLAGRQTVNTLLQSVLDQALGRDDPNATAWVQEYVQSAYQKVLGREGDAGGMEFWAQALKTGSIKVNDLYQTFAKSEEAISKGVTNLDDYITRAYEVVLGRRPDPAGLAAWKSQIETGQMYIGDLYAAFRSSSEYINLIRDQIFGMGSNINNNTVTGAPSSGTNFSSTVSNAVNSAYSTILGRQADAGGAEWWRSQVLSGGLALSDLNMSLARTAAAQQTTTDAYAAIQWLRSQGVPGFATGGYHMGGIRLVGENGPELESTGEARIWTAQQTRNMLSGVANRNSQNGDLVAEIQRLNDKIDSLERTVQQGDLMNAQATERNTQQVSGTIKDTTSKATYTNRLQTRAAIA